MDQVHGAESMSGNLSLTLALSNSSPNPYPDPRSTVRLLKVTVSFESSTGAHGGRDGEAA
eukprot:1278360-Amorphochlora_amoeboformis.AAC.1